MNGARPADVAVVRFELIERDGQTIGSLEVLLQNGSSLQGILVDIVAAARNDERALTYPESVRDVLGEDAAAALTTFLLPHIRLLTHRRVVPLEATLNFAP